MTFDLNRPRSDSKQREMALEDMRRAAKHFGYRRFSRHEFDQVATYCKGTTIIKIFGTWQDALDAIGHSLKPHRVDRKQISDSELLSELARVWRELGHRPSKLEWEASNARYSYTTYKQRFGGWLNACATLASGDMETSKTKHESRRSTSSPRSTKKRPPISQEDKRTIPLKLRLKIFSRDNFKCVLCGRTPATHANAVLHIDHIVPFSRGGKTEESNLQTLCEKCNWGKGADESADAVG